MFDYLKKVLDKLFYSSFLKFLFCSYSWSRWDDVGGPIVSTNIDRRMQREEDSRDL